jgi:hypothetical protein
VAFFVLSIIYLVRQALAIYEAIAFDYGVVVLFVEPRARLA